MSSANLRIVGIVCLIVCGICIFVAIERYQSNANSIAAIKEMGRGFPGSPFESASIEAATPTATKYALFLALVSGVGGLVRIVRSRTNPEGDRDVPRAVE